MFRSLYSTWNRGTCKRKYGDFPLGSPISFHLLSIEGNFDILSNITKSIDNSNITSSVFGSACNLIFEFLKIENVVAPTEWAFSKEEEEILQQLRIDNCESLRIINLTISQSECQEWFEQKKKTKKQTKKQKKKKKKNRT